RPVYENLPAYRTPTWLMTGVWMSDSSGFAVTPPHADADAVAARPVGALRSDTGAYERTAGTDATAETRDSGPRSDEAPGSPDSGGERMVARDRGEDGAGSATKPREPRIEQYRER